MISVLRNTTEKFSWCINQTLKSQQVIILVLFWRHPCTEFNILNKLVIKRTGVTWLDTSKLKMKPPRCLFTIYGLSGSVRPAVHKVAAVCSAYRCSIRFICPWAYYASITNERAKHLHHSESQLHYRPGIDLLKFVNLYRACSTLQGMQSEIGPVF